MFDGGRVQGFCFKIQEKQLKEINLLGGKNVGKGMQDFFKAEKL